LSKPKLETPLRDLADSVDEALRPQTFGHGFVARGGAEQAQPITLPAWFIDRCRRAYLAIPFSTPSRVVGITSALHGDGKTSVAIGIATAMAADTQEPTLLVECDLEKPSFYSYFGLSAQRGLSDWLDGIGPLRVARSPSVPNLVVIPSGAPHRDPARLLYQLSESNMFAELKPRFRNIVFDLPPTLDIAYGSMASKLADHLLVVARFGVTTVEDLEKVMFLLGPERVSGIVLNATEYRTPWWLRRLL
jgi:Mrp family chromosome partitioning ATPase